MDWDTGITGIGRIIDNRHKVGTNYGHPC